MALLNCPECGKKFSSLAEMCPECGCPTAVAETWKGRLPVPESDMLPPASSGNPTSSASTKSIPAVAASSPPQSVLDLDLDKAYLGKRLTMRFVSIPAGEFLMGSPDIEEERDENEEQHFVTLRQSFYLGVYPVTQVQYEAVMGANPSDFKGVNLPVEQVSWDDAVEFCRKLSEKAERKVRLPTEAEWEYACRAGTTTPFSFGETINTEQANYNGEYTYGNGHKGESRKKTTPVGSFPANPWGLYDMHGNVWEWCSDWYGDYPKWDVIDPKGTPTGEVRVLRGGSWCSSPRFCRSASRSSLVPGRSGDVGFRLALD